jgi:16S rRNA (adenine1518-N6/adenine1519-N6)-dimethyltransferase
MLKTLIEGKIKPKKSLSQNFLINAHAAKRIVDSLNLKRNETVLEIGPGLGALTKYLIEKFGRVIGVEIDRNICNFLRRSFPSSKNLEIINQDFLKMNFEKVILSDKRIKVIGNLPYQITSPVLKVLVENRERIKMAVLMVQKEVAQRICGKPGTKSWSPLSIGIQLYSDPQILFKLKPSSFKPSPKVESAIIKLFFLRKPKIKIEDEKFFFIVVKAAFSQRRKMVLNSVSSSLGWGKDLVFKALSRSKIDPKKRAEDLTLGELGSLARNLKFLKQKDEEIS